MIFNQEVLNQIAKYPMDGTNKYHWVPGFDGVTQPLVYKGITIASPNEAKETYCCGLTFEVYFKVAEKLGSVLADPKKMKADWFVATGKRKGPVDALVTRGLGTEVKLLDAQPGDFCQIWRQSGSGHSVIFMAHDQGKLTYWSTQPATNGIGKRTEQFGGVPNPITEIYIARGHA